MRHPSEGVLRRLIDEPAGVTDNDRTHIADCPRCATALAGIREDASAISAALSTEGEADTAAAWERLQATPAATGSRTTASHREGRLRTLVRRPAVAVVAVGVVLAGASAAAANNWLEIFRTETIAPLTLSTEDLTSLPDLAAYGQFAVPAGSDIQEVPDAATAATRSGLDVPQVASLPRGVSGMPEYHVGGEVTATFTFSAERAAQAAARAGEPLPTPPPGLDGHTVRLVAGPGVAQVWNSRSGAPALLVGRARAPKAFSTGLPFETVRDYMLSLPGLPDDVAAQLRTFTADGSTLPLPVPSDRVRTSSTDVDGVPATLLRAHDRSMAAVVWVKDGVVTVVAGSLDDSEVVSVARELR